MHAHSKSCPSPTSKPQQTTNKHIQKNQAADKEYRIRFGQIFLSRPLVTEADGETASLYPREARLRNITCAGALFAAAVCRCVCAVFAVLLLLLWVLRLRLLLFSTAAAHR
jgi:DNA-directed RNA polymerase beta subunit